jgi:filamentous hemagglutinin family protein
MKHYSEICKSLRLAALLFLAGHAFNAPANPAGLTVSTGTAIAQQIGAQLNLTVSRLAVLHWNSFNISAGETTSFLQPSANSIVFNIIGGSNPSQVFGNLNANGTVILANANGFYFGPNSMIKVGGSFIATTAPLAPDFGSGGMWQFTGTPPLASIVNYGRIEVGRGRSLFLIAENIENHGSLNAPGGNVQLAAGENVLVSDSPDGRGLSATVQLPQGSVDNFGRISADAGTIALQAKVVNQDGIIQADSVQNRNGVIELVASGQLNLGANSQILARGDNSASGSSGGSVTLQSGNDLSDSVGSQISVAGGANGGNGGKVEISAPNILSLNSSMDAGAQSGWLGGTFFLDPANIVLGTSTANGAINVNSAFAGFSQILLQASGNITLNAGTTWNLSTTAGVGGGQLTLEASGNITFGNNSKITDANNWSVTLDAGYNPGNNTIQSGVGNIYLNGGGGLSQNGTIQLSGGSINLFAGQSILVGSGSVFTTGGGSIYANALAGDINAGTSNGSSTSGGTQTSDYLFTASGSRPNAILGGISTAAGGDVTLIAGNNVVSVPTVPTSQWPGASGAYGAGNVTIIAGNQITGNYVLANGVGTLLAGVQVQSAQAGILQNPNANRTAYASALNDLETKVTQTQNPGGNIGAASGASGPVTLSLIQGSWNAWAANNIYIKEVNNPNGAFNSLQSFLFNYAPDAAVNLWAGNAIALAGANLTRVNRQNQNMPPIYAPILTLNAGADGITIDNSIILYPSSEGSLQITTRNRGDLNGLATSGSTVLNGITMSDSDSANWKTFATGHAATPLHLNDPNPVMLDISGDINSFGLTVPTFANIAVAGDTYNFGFVGQNLSPAQTTSINVTGNIIYRGDLTSETLSSAISPGVFGEVIVGDPALAGGLRYDATSGTISFVGVMGSATEQSLLNPTDANGNAIFTGTQLTAWQTTITQLYAASQSASLGDNGLVLSGPGNFNIKANSIDLGISGGISVLAPINVATSVPVDSLFSPLSFKAVLDGDPELASKLKYDAASGTLIFSGVMSPAEFYFLSLYQSPDFSPYINKLYAENQKDILGATINVTTAGDLEMTSTKIANESYLGGINLNVGGTLDVGGELTTFGDPGAPKGIFTTSGGNVSVTANGNVNVDGSRIAAYDGGDITIESFTGDVNAGTGGAGYVSLNALELDPATGQLESIPATIPGSGILATTVSGSRASLGNILIETPNGNISASQGGVIQISFNGTDDSKAIAELLAGYELRDAHGNRVLADNLASGTPVPVLSARNVVSLGSTILGVAAGSSLPVSLTQILDANGNPLLDASGNPLYVKTFDARKQIVEIVNGSIQPCLDSSGNPLIVAVPFDVGGHPFYDSHGNLILVLGRNIDAGGAGVIAQNIIAKATGITSGLFVGRSIDITTTGLGKIITYSQETPKIGDGPGGLPPIQTDPSPPVIISPDLSTAAPPPAPPKTEAPAADTATTVATKAENQDDDLGGDSKNKGKGIELAKKTSRVTVILPTHQQQSKARNTEPGT